MTTLERIILWVSFLGMLLVGGYSFYKVSQIRAWGNQVIAFTDHIQAKHSEQDTGGDHVPKPPPPPPF
jgi:hypothetical protein